MAVLLCDLTWCGISDYQTARDRGKFRLV